MKNLKKIANEIFLAVNIKELPKDIKDLIYSAIQIPLNKQNLPNIHEKQTYCATSCLPFFNSLRVPLIKNLKH